MDNRKSESVSHFVYKALCLHLFPGFPLFIIPFLSVVNSPAMENKLPIADTCLVLNGEGFRIAYGMRMYQCGLYLLSNNSEPQSIIKTDAPMAVVMVIKSSLITGKRLDKSTREGFRNSTGEKYSRVASEIDKFLSMITEDLKKDDIFTFIYTPQRGTEIIKNRKSLGIIAGLAFKKALFGIWLCDKPPTLELKNSMLGMR